MRLTVGTRNLPRIRLCQPMNLLSAQEVRLPFSLAAIISQHGHRVICERCGEDIINEREVRRAGHVLCRACANGAYYLIPRQ